MPPPPEQEEQKPLPRPKPKPPKPKTGPEPRPKPPGPLPLPQRDATPSGGLLFPPDPFACVNNCSDSCALYRLCPPPASHAATVHLRSGRLPTPLIALSASLLAVSAVLLLALLVHRLVRRRRRRRRAREAALAQGDEEGGQVLAGAVAGDGEEEEAADGDGVHHVWYIRTKGLDERAIAAIAAVVYDAKKRGAGAVDGGDGDGSCAVCLAEFRDGETLRLLPRCGHAFHRGCIDTWLRAHVNCPLCRAPVQVAAAAVPGAATPGGELEPDLGAAGAPRPAEDGERGGVPDRAVRRAASMVALPRRAWPDVSFRAPASNSGREEDFTGLGKIMRLLKFADSLEMARLGVGRSASFGAGSCQHLPTRSGHSAAGVSSGEMPQ